MYPEACFLDARSQHYAGKRLVFIRRYQILCTTQLLVDNIRVSLCGEINSILEP